MNPRSLRFRLVAWYAGLLTAVFLLFGLAMFQVLRQYLERSLAESLRRRSEQIGASLLANVAKTGERYVADEIKARYAPENYDRFIRISRADGSVLYASGRAASFDPAGLPEPRPGAAARQESCADGNRLLIMAQTCAAATGGSYLVESGAPLQPVETVLAQWRNSLLLGFPLVLLVAVAGGYFLVGRALGPVVAIARSAERITLHNLDERLPLTHTSDELEQLSIALNNMIDRLREAFDQNRRFLADASHELRTPLAALRGEMESVVEQARALPEWRDRVGSALEEVDRLAKIVDTLFAISRLDAGEAQQVWTKFDLARLASSTAEQMSLLAEDKGVKVSCQVPAEVKVEGDRARIKQVVVNLLDNAIKYTPRGGAVSLHVQARGCKAILEVVDTGIGIPAGALPHVFERFFRVDKARSREAGGAGLGLAIVKSICAAHGGKVEVESVEGKGSWFRVELPLASTVTK
ncbi:MAG: heavy metal sensor histidine kinase [Verrucomicrobiota bacterium]|jgi:heavy metal sensor kinase